MIHSQSIALLMSDLRVALAANSPQEALRRITLFEMMHLSDEESDSEVEMAGRKRLVLRVETDEIIVCDEYTPEDGRVHIIPAHRYAMFDKAARVLEWQKVSMDVISIIYEADEWPADLNDHSHAAVVAYFIGMPA